MGGLGVLGKGRVKSSQKGAVGFIKTPNPTLILLHCAVY